jgi:hypothetical protein
MAGKKKSREVTPQQLAALSELGRKSAAAEFNPEMLRIQQTYSIPEVIEMVHQAEAKPMNTVRMIAEVAKCIAEGRPYWPVALKLRPDLPLEKAKDYLRSRVSKNRAKIDAAVLEYKHKHVTR